MVKPPRVKAPPPSNFELDSEPESDLVSASNIKTEPNEELEALIGSAGLSSGEAASEDSGDEDEDEGDDDDGGNDDDEDDDEDDYDDGEPLPPRQVFKSAVLAPNIRSEGPSKVAARSNDSTSSDDDNNDDESSSSSSSDGDSSSDSDSESESDGDNETTWAQKTSAKIPKDRAGPSSKAAAAKAKVWVPGNDGGDDSNASDDASDSSPSSSSGSDSDSEEDEETSVAKKVALSDNDAPASGLVANADEIESSDDEYEDIPSTLPPGTQPDVQSEDTDEAAQTAGVAAEEDEEAPAEGLENNQSKQTSEDEAAAVPATPDEAPEPEPAPSAKRASWQRAKKQVAKVPYTPDAAANDNDEAANGEPAKEETEAPPSARSSRKRKRATIETPENDGNENPLTPASRSSKKQSLMQTPASRSSAAAANGGRSSTKKGPQGNFTPREVSMLEAAAAKYMEENNVSQSDFNVMVHENAQKHTALWNDITSDFPDKKRLQVILRCRRIFHNFKQQYRWTEEEDAELADLVSRHGNKWQVIAGVMDRSSEDVRKRWEERVVCGDKVLLSYWRFDEERTLGQIVGRLLREIQSTRKQDLATIHPDSVRDIPWQVVSERMGHTRTARQCRSKWRAIQEAYHFNPDGEFVGPPPPSELSNSQIKAEKMHARFLKNGSSTPAKSSPLRPPAAAKAPKTHLPLLGIASEENGITVPETGRPITKRTRQQVLAMSNEDKYRLVLSIRDSNVGRLDKIPWTKLVDVSYRKQYDRAARELVWSRLRRSVPNHNRKSVRQVCDYLIKEYDADDKLGQAWDIDFDDETQGEEGPTDGDDDDDNAPTVRSTSAIVKAIAAAKSKRQVTNKVASAKSFKSNEFVAESDSEQGESEVEPEEVAEAVARPRTRGGAKAAKVNGRLNGDAEKHVSESEAEEEVRLSRAARATPAAASRPKGQGAKTTRGQVLLDPYLDIEGASTPSNSQAKPSQEDDIEYVADDEDGARRRDREASVDLSMGDKLSSAQAGGDSGAQEEPELELPLTLSLSPSLAQNKPTARSRPLPISKQKRGDNGPESDSPSEARPALASRFQQQSNIPASSSKTALTPLRPGHVRRTKKRSLNSATWHADMGDNEDGGADDIEEVSDADKGGYSGFSAISGLVKNAFMSRKRPRQNGGR
ncbi:RNA polymerase I enhancer binding protein [Sporothrix eucalyptigena]